MQTCYDSRNFVGVNRDAAEKLVKGSLQNPKKEAAPSRPEMSRDEQGLPLLNVFEVEDSDGITRHLICFVDPVLGGAVGLNHECIVGDFEPRPDGGFDPASFRPNPDFLLALQRYMNEEVLPSAAVENQARQAGQGQQVILDPRYDPEEGEAPTIQDVVGSFAVEPSGEIIPGSFRLNEGHTLFDPDRGLSGLFFDREFYDWLHPERDFPRVEELGDSDEP